MKSIKEALVVLVLTTGTLDGAQAGLVPIDSSMFTVDSAPGVASWNRNSLTLDISKGGPLYGGFAQTRQLDTALLPRDVIGISFSISSSLSNPRISFGYLVYDLAGYGHGVVGLYNYASNTRWDLSTYTRRTEDLGTGSTVNVYLGASYSPFGLLPTVLNERPLDGYPRFSVDFRADGWNGRDYLPGTATFSNICWITAGPQLSSTPEPSSLAVACLAGAIAFPFLWLRPRRRS
jgi:hypothetical protein